MKPMEELDRRYQTLIVLWAAFLMNIAVLFVVTRMAAPPPTTPTWSMLVDFGLGAVGAFLVGISFAVKNRLLKQSVEQQDVSLVQKALVLACAICELCALIGLLGAFIVGWRDYYVLFFIAAAGIAFNFPRRIQLEAANYKRT